MRLFNNNEGNEKTERKVRGEGKKGGEGGNELVEHQEAWKRVLAGD